jgi:hypothetical protein
MQHAGDLSAECQHVHDSSLSPDSNRERTRFERLVQQYSRELKNVVQECSQNSSTDLRLDLLEVFCGPQSQSKVISRQPQVEAFCSIRLLANANAPRTSGFLLLVAHGVDFHV